MALIFERDGKWAINYLDERSQRRVRECDANQSIVDAKRLAEALELTAATHRKLQQGTSALPPRQGGR